MSLAVDGRLERCGCGLGADSFLVVVKVEMP